MSLESGGRSRCTLDKHRYSRQLRLSLPVTSSVMACDDCYSGALSLWLALTTQRRDFHLTTSRTCMHAFLLDTPACQRQPVGEVDGTAQVHDQHRPSGSVMTMMRPRASEIQHLLRQNHANVCGGEVDGRLIVTLPVRKWTDVDRFDQSNLKKVFTFLLWAGSGQEETRPLEYVVVADFQENDWSLVKDLVQLLEAIQVPGLKLLYLITPSAISSKLSLAKFSIKGYLAELPFGVVQLNSKKALHASISPEQLPCEYGGELVYNHDDWISLHLEVETMLDDCQAQHMHICQVVESTAALTVASSAEKTKLLIDLTQSDVLRHTEVSVMTLRRAVALLASAQHVSGRWRLSPHTRQFAALTKSVESEVVCLRQAMTQLEKTWGERKRHLDEGHYSQVFQQTAADAVLVLRDRLDDIRRLQLSVGDSSQAANALLSEYTTYMEGVQEDIKKADAVSSKCREVAALPHCHDPPGLLNRGEQLKDLRQQLNDDLMARSQLLTTGVHLHSAVEQGEEVCDNGFRLLATHAVGAGVSEESSSAMVDELQTFLQEVRGIDQEKIKNWSAAMPASASIQRRALVVCRKAEELEKLVSARIDGIQSLTQKHIELKDQLLAKLEKDSTGSQSSGLSSTGHTTPIVQDISVISSQSSSLPFEDGDFIQVEVLPNLPTPTRTQTSRQSRRPQRAITSISLNSPHPSPSKGPLVALPSQSLSWANNSVLASTSAWDSPPLSPPETRRDVRSSASAYDWIRDAETDPAVLEKRRYILEELIETERVYIEDLRETIETYWTAMNPNNQNVPAFLRGKQNILFGNLPRIYEFHKNVFLQELESCKRNPTTVGFCFLNKQRQFQLYVSYCKNKHRSEALLTECETSFFENIRKERGHRLSLKTFLIKPVQRITKYQLLLKDLMAKCRHAPKAREALQGALEQMLDILQHVNNVMHSIGIVGFPGSLLEQGHLLLQDSFHIWRQTGRRLRRFQLGRVERERHIFLYEQVIIFSKKRHQKVGDRRTLYSYKDSIKTSELALTENIQSDPTRFQVAHHNKGKVYTLQARTLEIKQAWVAEFRKLLQLQLTNMQDIELQEEGLLTLRKHSKGRLPPPGEPNSRSAFERSSFLQETVHHWSQEAARNHTVMADGPSSFMSSQFSSLGDISMDSLDSVVDGLSDDDSIGEPEMEDLSGRSRSGSIMLHLSPNAPRFYTATNDFQGLPQEPGHVSLSAGEMVEVLKLGHGGWWHVRKCLSGTEGWAPAGFLTLANPNEPKIKETAC